MTVKVGSSGLVAVYAEADMQLSGPSMPGDLMLSEPTDLSGCKPLLEIADPAPFPQTVSSVPGSGVGTLGPGGGGFVIVHVTPGMRTFSLRQSFMDPNPPRIFSVQNQQLWVIPL